MRKKIIPFIFCLLLCGHCANDSSFQNEVDRALRGFALTSRTFVNFFQNDLKSCKNFLNVYDAISTEPQTCDNGKEGFFQLTKLGVQCEDSSPLNASAFFQINQENCQDDDTNLNSTGIFNLEVNFSGEGNIGYFSPQNLIANEITYFSEELRIKINFSNNNLSCSGELTVNGDQTCETSSDCESCSL